MAIPTYDQIMFPLLCLCGDGNEHSRKKLVESLSDHFQLSEEERQKRLPSGSMTYLYNRLGWAKLGLLKAGLITSPKRGIYKITNEGGKLINSGISDLDSKYLYDNYASFREWKGQTSTGITENTDESIESTIAPQELIEISHKKINDELSSKEICALLPDSKSS